MAEESGPQTFGFRAEVKQLLHLVVHSLYSNKEIFLRELISNASDANDKLRFQALADPGLLEEEPELEIRVAMDPERRQISVTDNGIGMSRTEIAEQLGTIAHSGTSRFLERLSGDQAKDAELIGQFGVGFYSAFIVADQVEVLSRKAGAASSEGVCWVSDGEGEYSLESVDKPSRGTIVTLKLKPEAAEFLDARRLRDLIRKYSDHIAFPIRMRSEAEEASWETVNKAKALWRRSRTEIEDEEYIEFYKHIAHDSAEPLAWSHNRVEGKREYTSLLYVPSEAPFDLWNREKPRGIKLYVQRVFITDEATQFLPLYLRFVRGVIDCSDLPLNVSREVLQQDPNVGAIRSALTKRVLDMLASMSREQPEKYATFWRQFGTVLKEGLGEDPQNREKIAGLLRFETSRSENSEQLRSLDQYLEDAGDKPIYYLVSDSLVSARSNPHLEVFRQRGIEVLLLADRIDEWAMEHLVEYRGHAFRDVSRGKLDFGAEDDEKHLDAEPTKEQKHVLKRAKRVLRDKVGEVRFSRRLTESTACLVLGEQDLGYQMRELLKAAGHALPEAAPALELNPSHPLVRRLESENDDARFEQLALLIFEQAVLAEGRSLEDPAAFVKRLNRLLAEVRPDPE
jgi:molecular chaperone HtpG